MKQVCSDSAHPNYLGSSTGLPRVLVSSPTPRSDWHKRLPGPQGRPGPTGFLTALLQPPGPGFCSQCTLAAAHPLKMSAKAVISSQRKFWGKRPAYPAPLGCPQLPKLSVSTFLPGYHNSSPAQTPPPPRGQKLCPVFWFDACWDEQMPSSWLC